MHHTIFLISDFYKKFSENTSFKIFKLKIYLMSETLNVSSLRNADNITFQESPDIFVLKSFFDELV